jgi:oxygen-dependent protoporphyrinogen oxidase
MAHTGILDATDKILKKYPGLYITGNAYRGIGINDCVEHGYRIADEIASSIGDM